MVVKLIVIVEGINKTGKSTVCDILSHKFAAPIFKDMSLVNSMISDIQTYSRGGIYALTNMFGILSRLDNISLIVDRFHLTEAAYGKVFRKYDIDYFADIDSRLASNKNVLLILMTDSIEKINERHGFRHDKTDIYNCMNDFYRSSAINKHEFNFASGMIPMVNWIVKETGATVIN